MLYPTPSRIGRGLERTSAKRSFLRDPKGGAKRQRVWVACRGRLRRFHQPTHIRPYGPPSPNGRRTLLTIRRLSAYLASPTL